MNVKSSNVFIGIWKARQAYYFLIPIFVFLFSFKYGPFFIAVVKSFYQWNGANINRFIGIDNFIRILSDESFRASLSNMLILTFGGLFANLTFPLIAAVLVYHICKKKIANATRILFIIPLVVPGIVVIRIWSWIYEGQGGILNNLMRFIGMGDYTRSWLGESDTSIWALVFFNFPWIGGIFFLIYLAGLMAISTDLFEAGEIDGMGRWARFWHLELPLIRSQIKLVVLLTLITQIQNFELSLILTNGGPGDSSLTPALHLYNRAFIHNEMGYASAIGLVLFLFILVITIINFKFMKSTEKID